MDEELLATLRQLHARLLRGETVEIGIFQARENFLYTGKKDATGNPTFRRVLSLAYVDEDEDDNPSVEAFDGSFDQFVAGLEAHDAIGSMAAEEEDFLCCRECGKEIWISSSGVAHHRNDDSPDAIDHDADADHVAIIEYDEGDD